MGQEQKRYHITDDGEIFQINDDGSFTAVGNVIQAAGQTHVPQFHQSKITFPDELRFKASLIKLFNNIGGHLYIYPEEIVFKPFGIYIFSSERRWNISDILGYQRHLSILNTLVTRSGKVTIDSWKIKTILNELEQRRQAYYTNRGLLAPLLQEK